jgi:hypothetical protein
MPPDTPTNRQLARQLIERVPVPPNAEDHAVAAAEGACEHVYLVLVRWVGATGTQALFSRSLADARRVHPALAQIRLQADTTPRIVGIAEAARENGPAATAAALEALLATLINLLGRFIGEDMVANLVDRNSTDSDAAGGQPDRQGGIA